MIKWVEYSLSYFAIFKVIYSVILNASFIAEIF